MTTSHAGWYPDPENPTTWRWWNGWQWVDAHPPPPSQFPSLPIGTAGPDPDDDSTEPRQAEPLPALELDTFDEPAELQEAKPPPERQADEEHESLASSVGPMDDSLNAAELSRPKPPSTVTILALGPGRVRLTVEIVKTTSLSIGDAKSRLAAGPPITLELPDHATAEKALVKFSKAGATAVIGPTELAPSGTFRAEGITSWRDAEIRAASWMRQHGFPDAVITGGSADGGIDVYASRAIAQVKAQASRTPRPDVQRLAGVASVQSRLALFFSLGGYTTGALEWADQAGIATFTLDRNGQVTPENPAAWMLARQKSSPGTTAPISITAGMRQAQAEEALAFLSRSQARSFRTSALLLARELKGEPVLGAAVGRCRDLGRGFLLLAVTPIRLWAAKSTGSPEVGNVRWIARDELQIAGTRLDGTTPKLLWNGSRLKLSLVQGRSTSAFTEALARPDPT